MSVYKLFPVVRCKFLNLGHNLSATCLRHNYLVKYQAMLAQRVAFSQKNVDPCEEDKQKAEGETKEEDTIDFNNAERAFKSKSNSELLRACVVYVVFRWKFLTDRSETLMKIGQKVLGRRLFNWLMKKTFYGQFVGGESKDEVMHTLSKMRKYNVRSILDYAVEEDISQQEAQEKEMKSVKLEKDDSRMKELGGDMPQYHPSEEFADRRRKVVSARTYFYENEATCDRNADAFIESINAVVEDGDRGFVAVKLTALGRPQMLLQLSEVIMRAREFSHQITGHKGSVIKQALTMEDLEKKLETAGIKDSKEFLKEVVRDKDGVIHLFPWYGIINDDKELNATFKIPNLKEGKMVYLISQLSKTEEEMFRNMIARFNRIICAAEEHKIHILVDAEQSYFQPAIARTTLEMMHRYNKSHATIFNTYQCYLKDAYSEITADLEQAHRQNFRFGGKMVRGAYSDQEAERAEKMKYSNPVLPDYEATENMYHTILNEVLNKIMQNKKEGNHDQISIMVASHNENTIRCVLRAMKKYNIPPDDSAIYFAQLYGMSDYITFPLGDAGYSSYKYLPYGPVHEVLPYLARRAKENAGMLRKTKKERKMLLSELKRRIMKGQFFYSPNKS